MDMFISFAFSCRLLLMVTSRRSLWRIIIDMFICFASYCRLSSMMTSSRSFQRIILDMFISFASYQQAVINYPVCFFLQAVIDGDFEEIALEDYRGRWLIFFFYPLDFTFVCPTEIIAFSDRFPEFEALNAAVVACSTDSCFSHLAWVNTPRKQGGDSCSSCSMLHRQPLFLVQHCTPWRPGGER